MATNIRSPRQLRNGTKFTRELESDAHYNGLLSNELLTKAEFPSGVHEVISDPGSNTNPTREFYQLSILTTLSTNADSEVLLINPIGNTPIVAEVTVAPGETADSIATKINNYIIANHSQMAATPRYANIDQNVNIINFATIDRGVGNDHQIDLSSTTFPVTNIATGISWRIDILSDASDADGNTEIVLDAGIWTGLT